MLWQLLIKSIYVKKNMKEKNGDHFFKKKENKEKISFVCIFVFIFFI